jgi:hypothetical protein
MRTAAPTAAEARPDPRLAGARTPTEVRPRGLRLVQPVRRPAPKAPFVVLLGALLTTGLAGLLYLHTALAEDSFRLHDLATRSAVLADQEQALEQEVAEAASPSRLAERAEALGMVRSENPAFIRLSDGAVLGKPKPGVAPPPPPAPTPSASPSTSASSGSGAAEQGDGSGDPEAAGDGGAPAAEDEVSPAAEDEVSPAAGDGR